MIRCVKSLLNQFLFVLTHEKKIDFDEKSQVGPNTEVSHVAQLPRCLYIMDITCTFTHMCSSDHVCVRVYMFVHVCVSVGVKVVKIHLDPTLADVQAVLSKRCRFTALIYHT